MSWFRMRRWPGALGLVASVCLCCALLVSGEPTPKLRQVSAPAIQVTTRLVQIDVIVRDKDGPVANLTKDDFSIFDRGKQQVDQPMPDSLRLVGALGVHDLHLAQKGDLHTGTVDLIVIEQDGTGKIVRESANRINVRLTGEQYARALKAGFQFRQIVQPQVGVTTLRVLVQDAATAAVGSVIIPLAEVR